MGDMRKDYVLERDVIVHPTTKKSADSKNMNFRRTNPFFDHYNEKIFLQRNNIIYYLSFIF